MHSNMSRKLFTITAILPAANMRYVETASMPPGGQAFSIMPYGHISRESLVDSRISTIRAAMLMMPAAKHMTIKQLTVRRILEPREFDLIPRARGGEDWYGTSDAPSMGR